MIYVVKNTTLFSQKWLIYCHKRDKMKTVRAKIKNEQTKMQLKNGIDKTEWFRGRKGNF